jgi:hypothetical protein
MGGGNTASGGDLSGEENSCCVNLMLWRTIPFKFELIYNFKFMGLNIKYLYKAITLLFKSMSGKIGRVHRE